jgi:uncharacterized protein
MEFENHRLAFRALTGSHNYNLNMAESDKDYKYFVFPTFDDLYSGKYYTNAKTSPELDYTVHDIRHLGDLIWKANINFLEVLFSTDYTYFDNVADSIISRGELYASMNLKSFRNATYGMHVNKMLHLLKGTETTNALVERFGYDTKQACHALRCLYVLEKYAENQNMRNALWFENGTMRNTLLDVKAGVYSLDDFQNLVHCWEKEKMFEVFNFYLTTSQNLDAKEDLESRIKESVKRNLDL